MTIQYSKNFIKQAKKLSPKIQAQLQSRLKLFTTDSMQPILRNHPLSGKYKDYRSVDITGDYRALYLQKENEVIFDRIGTHSQLYG